MVQNSVAHLVGQIESLAVFLKEIDHAQALCGVRKVRRMALLQNRLSRMSERRMSEIVSQRDRLTQIFIEKQRTRGCPCDLHDLQRVCQTCAVVVSRGCEKDLRFIHKASE